MSPLSPAIAALAQAEAHLHDARRAMPGTCTPEIVAEIARVEDAIIRCRAILERNRRAAVAAPVTEPTNLEEAA